MTAPVRLADVRKVYGNGRREVVALGGVTVDFPKGSFTAVMGPSGSGKSTLSGACGANHRTPWPLGACEERPILHCAAGLDEPTSGEVALVGTPLRGKNEHELTELRRERVSFVFQAFNLMPALTVWQNVTLPAVLADHAPDAALATEVLRRVGLGERVGHRPAELSGGQQQRVAIARALANRAEVIFADEPTGALDSHTALEVLDLLRDLSRGGQTIVLVTHDPVAASYADDVLFLVDGQIVTRLRNPTVEAVATHLVHLGGRS